MGNYDPSPSFARCVAYEEPASEDESAVYINSIRLEENGGEYISTFRSQPEAKTPIAVLRSTSIRYPNNDCMGERELMPDGTLARYRWISYSTFYEHCIKFAGGLYKLGVRKGDNVGIYSPNNIWWQMTNFACSFLGAICVPINDSLGLSAASYIITHAECKFLIVHSSKAETVSHVIKDSGAIGIGLITRSEDILQEGWYSCNKILSMADDSFVPYEPSPDDVAMIMYTSGSTGKPKGCVLTHGNIVAGGSGLASVGGSVTSSDTFFSFLPLAHIYELCVEMVVIAQGARIGFYCGDTKQIVSDACALQPTIMCAVPRVLTRMYDSMQAKIETLHPIVRTAIKYAIKAKNSALLSDKPHSLLLDMILFKGFRATLGGKIRLIVSGGAPILPEVYEFIKAVITPNIIQGYGLTEISAAGCVQEIGSKIPTSVGPVSIAADLKFRKVPGMNYDPQGNPPSGEIVFRGPGVFKGYYKDEELTKEVLKDGWFASGDVGVLGSDGTIQIFDRVKQLIKLSQGEYVSITSMTDIYSKTKGIHNIFIFADSHHNYLVALVIPTTEAIQLWKESGITDIIYSPVVKEEILKNLEETANSFNLRGFERIKNIIIDTDEFSVENGLLTPSLKPQLSTLRSKYESRLRELYK